MEYVDKELTHIINIIVNAFSDAFKKDENVYSIFAIGSMASPNYTPKQHNDFDLRLLVSNPTSKFFDKLERIADQLVAMYQHETKFELSWGSIIGPIRHVSSTRPTLLLHIVTLTECSLNSLPVMHRRSYASLYTIFMGADVLERYKDIPLSADSILNDTEGIRYCRNCLASKVLRYQKWQYDGESCRIVSLDEPFSDEVSYEFFRYSITKSMDNALAFFLQTKNDEGIRAVQGMASAVKSDIAISFEKYSEHSCYYLLIAQNLLSKLEVIILQMSSND